MASFLILLLVIPRDLLVPKSLPWSQAPKRQPRGLDVNLSADARRTPLPLASACVTAQLRRAPLAEEARALLNGGGGWLLRAGSFWVRCTPGARGERQPRGESPRAEGPPAVGRPSV